MATRETAERELVITRVLDAPREVVFKAWSDPERVKRWWGPSGFTTPVCEIDFRPDGVFHNCMRSPEGRDYCSSGIYQEIVEPERIVFTDTFVDEKGNRVEPSYYDMAGEWPEEMLVSVTFHGEGDRTRLAIRHSGIPQGEEKDMAEAGWSQSLDRLGEYLAGESDTEKKRRWLRKLVGDWTIEGSMTMEPDKPSETFEGTESVRSLDDIWIVAEGQSEFEECPGTTITTLGYDPLKKRFIGTFIASMMTHLWIYDGHLDEEEKALILDTEGPDMSTEGKMAKYRDVFEFESDDHRTLTSHTMRDDGTWYAFMKADYRRK